MSKLMHEIEIYDNCETPTYFYIETDDDINISIGSYDGDITHITTVDIDMGLEPDLVISRRVD